MSVSLEIFISPKIIIVLGIAVMTYLLVIYTAMKDGMAKTVPTLKFINPLLAFSKYQHQQWPPQQIKNMKWLKQGQYQLNKQVWVR